MSDQPVQQILSSFSAGLADLVERAAQFAVAIEARHRIGSSGFLWKSGVIVTADHTIRRDEEIPVILPDGKRTTAELAGRDPDTDIAVLRVKADTESIDLTAAQPLRTGELVAAIGRHEPGALAAVGIVSTAAGSWKTWRGGHLESLLRLDIGAYPRSSGSAVLDAQGRFAGMLTSGLTRTAPIAIPAATIHRVATELLEHGSLAHGYLGVGLQPVLLPPAFAAQLHREQRSAIMVLSVAPGGPAEQAGILLGDIVAGIGPHPTTDIDDLQAAIRGAVGKQLPVEILRSGQRVELQATVGERRSQ